MEYYQAIQNRSAQTIAVIEKYLPQIAVGQTGAAELKAASGSLDALALARDQALVEFDAAGNVAQQNFLALQSLTYALPAAAEAELDDTVPAESALIDLLGPAYGIAPRTSERALERGKKLVGALQKIDAHLAGLGPKRRPVTAGGRGAAELAQLMAAQPGLEQTVEHRAADVTAARTALRVAAVAVDRLNKRFYAKLQSEARTNPALDSALGQIETESAHLPGTLGVRNILQGGAEGRQLLVAYDPGSFDAGATNTLEWQVVGADADFAHSTTADPSGNALGPFAAGQTVRLRTRVTNANGTTTGSVRTLVLAA
ncbi:MAG: hypothetical protein JSR82_01330 [Verrucomicrobia bacterium]|nr:hypothetical protein [Verrucomicrobiota bacterium]